MAFELGDKVMVRANSDELESDLFQAIDGVRAEITEIYSTDYEPDVKRYEVTLENPVEINGERLAVVPGLYEDNLEKAEGKKKQLSENRAVTKFALFENKMEESSWYYGLADCHGIESFIKEPDEAKDWTDFEELFTVGVLSIDPTELPGKRAYNTQIGMIIRRAKANIQRFPVVYRAKLKGSDAMVIDRMLNKGLYEEALVYLKEKSEHTQLAKRLGGMNAERNWEKIPNPELDPMY
jgi:hypothetical protein